MALYHLEKEIDGGVLALWELTETEAELTSLIPITERKWELGKSEKRRKEVLAVHALLHEIFGVHHFIDHYPNGQPFICHTPSHISITHTQRFVGILTHPHKRVGIDIECLERNFSAVERKALSNKEISSLSQNRRSLHLAIMWSAKEALYKCISQEDVDFAHQMQIEPFVPGDMGTLNAHFFGNNQTRTQHFLRYKIVDNHVLVYMFA